MELEANDRTRGWSRPKDSEVRERNDITNSMPDQRKGGTRLTPSQNLAKIELQGASLVDSFSPIGEEIVEIEKETKTQENIHEMWEGL